MVTRMKKIKKERITAFVFLIIISVYCVSMFLNANAVRSSIIEGYENKTKNTIGKITGVIKSTESAVNTNFIDRLAFIDFNGFFYRLIGRNIFEDVVKSNTVYKMKNGQLTYLYNKCNVDKAVRNTSELYDYLNQKNMKMLYVQAPFKINKYDNQLPFGLIDNPNLNADNFISGIKNKGIPVLDLREEIKKSNFEYRSLFYNTDQHWKTSTAFWAYNQVLDRITNIPSDKLATDIDNFNATEYKDFFLGSQGRRVGSYYGGVDDYTLLTPDFETDYNVKITNYNGSIIKKSGTFEDCLIDDSLLDPDEPISSNRYAAYFGHDYPLVQITNNKVRDGKVLIIKDSFGLPFSAFMSLNFNQTDMIDLRYFRKQTLFKYLDNNQYDTVLFLYNPSSYYEGADKDKFKFN